MDLLVSQIGLCHCLLPAHSLGEIPTQLTPAEADDFLACWTVAWHPAILALQNAPSRWLRAGVDVPEKPYSILFVPQIAKRYLEDNLLRGCAASYTEIFQTDYSCQSRRENLWDRALAKWPALHGISQSIDSDLTLDFYALAFAYLQVQLMTRQLRYSSNFSQEPFDENLVLAAKFAAAGNSATAKEHLTICFDLLMQERDRYYPVRPRLVDLVLLAPTTLRESLNQQLEANQALTLLVTGQLTEQLAIINPTALNRIIERQDEGSLVGIGSNFLDLTDPLVSSESVLRQLIAGRETIKKHCGVEPQIYCRRRSGLTPTLPSTLESLEFLGAMHVALDGERVPNGSSVNIRWNGLDGNSIPAHCEPPLDASDASTLVRLAVYLGKQIDSSHTAVAVFAHWPNRFCEAFKDLIRIQKYAPVLGHFVHAEEYFDSLYDPGYGDNFSPGEYHSSYLQKAVACNQTSPLSRYIDYWQTTASLLSARALLTQLCLGQKWKNEPAVSDGRADIFSLLEEIRECEFQLDKSVNEDGEPAITALYERTLELQSKILATYDRLPGTDPHFFAAINTLNFRRRAALKMQSAAMVDRKNSRVIVADHSPHESLNIVELPGNFHCSLTIASSGAGGRQDFGSEPSMIDGLSLKNEFFEIQVDPRTGGLKSVTTYQDRTNLISQQLAARIPELPDDAQENIVATSARYTTMIAEKVEALADSRIRASIVARGKLVDQNRLVSEFVQKLTVTRGLPIAELEIELNPAGTWPKQANQYLCSRFAWKDEQSGLSANFQEFHQPVGAEWFHATHFFQIDQGEQNLVILTGGLPYHRRASRRMVDSLLIVGNEQRRHFRFGIGVNLPYPQLSAVSWLTPLIICSPDSLEPSGFENWLFHFDRKNILVTWWEPEFDSHTNGLAAIQFRCRETEGRGGELTITCREPVTSASLVRFNNKLLRPLPHDSQSINRFVHRFQGFESFQIKICL